MLNAARYEVLGLQNAVSASSREPTLACLCVMSAFAAHPTYKCAAWMTSICLQPTTNGKIQSRLLVGFRPKISLLSTGVTGRVWVGIGDCFQWNTLHTAGHAGLAQLLGEGVLSNEV